MHAASGSGCYIELELIAMLGYEMEMVLLT